jgi:hypothetical protein
VEDREIRIAAGPAGVTEAGGVRLNTFAGFMSRCTMPRACADSSASAIWMPSSTAAAGDGPEAAVKVTVPAASVTPVCEPCL